MVLKAFFAAAATLAVTVGLLLPTPGSGRMPLQSQVSVLEVGSH